MRQRSRGEILSRLPDSTKRHVVGRHVLETVCLNNEVSEKGIYRGWVQLVGLQHLSAERPEKAGSSRPAGHVEGAAGPGKCPDDVARRKYFAGAPHERESYRTCQARPLCLQACRCIIGIGGAASLTPCGLGHSLPVQKAMVRPTDSSCTRPTLTARQTACGGSGL